ncbi:lipase family protein [Nocardia abscessus]|uniref:lipase family protein n=1 Tax=Nocardia abscessus TaxID=120957 RepID=UPI0002F633AB|nr:lipase family protein [Nocardia abscessus]MCC3328244.1 lipase family protein [Nocardia abscessus]
MTEPITIDDDFYSTPDDGIAAPAGQLLRRRPITLTGLRGAGPAWQVVYATTGSRAPMPASGTVITPSPVAGLKGPGPVLVYCPSFHGLGGRCAPSHLLAEGRQPESESITAALERGWTVAVADGPCLGMTGLGPHQFLAGAAGGHAVLDLARATRALPDLDGAPCVVWGYADGGRSAAWAAEQQPRYAPDLDLRGVAAGGVVADPGALIEEIDGGPWAGLALAGLIGLSRAYSYLPVGHLITNAGREAIEQAGALDAAALLLTYREQPLGKWCERADPWNDPIWRYVLANETSGRSAPKVPVHLYHGIEDALVPVAIGRQLFAQYRSLGVDLSWREYPTSHVGAAKDGAAEAVARLAGYLQHRPTPPNPQTT